MSKLLTITMAAYGEFDSVWATLLGLRTFHDPNHDKFDIGVVDNARDRCPRTEGTVRSVSGWYQYRPDLNGTSRSRDACFKYATTPWVMVIDSHVFLEPGAVDAAIRYAEEHPDSIDMVQGPIVGDDGRWTSSEWSKPPHGGLWSTWSNNPEYHKRWERDKEKHAIAVTINGVVGSVLTPGATWSPDRAGVDALEPWPIFHMGLGLWMMRREAWPGFNPFFRGFGGEEGYVHEVVRQRGGRALCHPALRWRHKFRDIEGWDKNPIPYPSFTRDHIRNMVIGHREVGIDPVVIKTEFGKKVDDATWTELTREAESLVEFGKIKRPTRQKILGIWYSNNAAPPTMLGDSLASIATAAWHTSHDVRIVTCPWLPIQGNPFQEAIAKFKSGPAHLNIARQQQQAIAAALARDPDWKPDAVSFLEHDVLYPPGYFDRVGDALSMNPAATVVSHKDYIGLNATGWLATVQRHEPLHQLTVRYDFAIANLARAEQEAVGGICELEPDPHHRYEGQAAIPLNPDRSRWHRIEPDPGIGFAPSVHVNNPGRLTSHGEACYQSVSAGPDGKPMLEHPYWGVWSKRWPGEIPTAPAAPDGCGGCTDTGSPVLFPHVDVWLAQATKESADFHHHTATVREYATRCEHVTEFCDWGKPARIALASGCKGKFASYSSQPRPEWTQLRVLLGDRFEGQPCKPTGPDDIAPTDLLFIDTREHSAQETYPLLDKFHAKVAKYIIIHTTEIFGEKAADGTMGNMCAVRGFLRARPEWKVARYDPENYGMIVLSKAAEDRVELPPLATMAKNVIVAKLKHWWRGRQFLPLPMAEERLSTCMVCPLRQDMRCTKCGCYLDVVDPEGTDGQVPSMLKGSPGRVFYPDRDCPVGKWPMIDPTTIDDDAWPAPIDDAGKPIVVACDLDGVVGAGFRSAEPFVIVSGRMVNETNVVTDQLMKSGLFGVGLYLRTKGIVDDGVAAGEHKSAVVKRLGITVFYEDDRPQAERIKKDNPGCSVRLVDSTLKWAEI